MLKVELSARGAILVVLALACLWFIPRVWPVLLLVIVALIFTTALLPYVEWLARHRVRRPLAVLGVVATVILVLVGAIAIVAPAIFEQFRDIRDTLPEDARRLEDLLADIGIDVELEERARNIDYGELISGEVAIDYGQQVVYGIIAAFTVLVVTTYLLIDAPGIARYLRQFVPPDRKEDADRVLRSLSRVVGGYIRGQVITSFIIGTFTFSVLAILGVPNALAFGVLAGFADIIPIVGALLAIVPAAFAAFQESTEQAVAVLAALLAYQQFEDRYLVPRVYGATLNLPPLVVLVAVLAGGELLGIAGVLLALPATAAGRVFFDMWLEHRLGERHDLPGTVAAPTLEPIDAQADPGADGA